MSQDLEITLDFGTGVTPVTAASADPPEGLYMTEIIKIEPGETSAKNPKLVVHMKIIAPEKVGDEITAGRVVQQHLNLPHGGKNDEFYLGLLGQLFVAAGVATAEGWAKLRGKTSLPVGKLVGRKAPIHYLPGDRENDLFPQVTPLSPDEAKAVKEGTLKIRDGRKPRAKTSDVLGEALGGTDGGAFGSGSGDNGVSSGAESGGLVADDLFA